MENQNQPLDSPELPKEKPFKKVGTVVGINLLILLGLTALILVPSLGNSDSHAAMGFGLLMLMLIPAQVFINLIIGIVCFVRKDKETGKAFLLAMLAVAVVGTSACFGGSALFQIAH